MFELIHRIYQFSWECSFIVKWCAQSIFCVPNIDLLSVLTNPPCISTVNHCILRIFSLPLPLIKKKKNTKKISTKLNQIRFIFSKYTSLYCETASQICRKFSSDCCCCYFVVTQNNNNLWSTFSHGEFPVEVRDPDYKK